MANEFIIHKGFHSKGDSQITGSLQVSGSVTAKSHIVSGGVSTQFQKGDGTLDSTPYETVASATLKQYLATGFIDGLDISINTDTTKFDINSGSYIITNYTDLLNPIPVVVHYSGSVANTPNYLTSSNATYVALDINGNLVQSSSPFSSANRRDYATVGALIHSNRTNINTTNEILAPIVGDTNQLHDLMKVIGSLNLTGNVYSPSGSNLQIKKTAGTIFALGINAHDYNNPHVLTTAEEIPVTFRYRLQNGTEYSDVTSINPTQWDNNGTLTTVSNGKFTVQHIHLFQSNLTRIQYGQTEYANLADAKAFAATDAFVTEQNIAENSIFRCYLIVKKEVTNLTAGIALGEDYFIIVDKFGSVVGGAAAGLTYAGLIAALGYTPEDVVNKVTSISGASTNTQYPTAKLLYDQLLLKEAVASGTHTLVSGSSQLTSSYDTRYETQGSGIVSGSTQITPLLPIGTVSGSSQITLSVTTGYSTLATLYEEKASTSHALVSGSEQISFNGITNKPTLVSGSSQIIYTQLSSIPAGIVSGSTQITPLLPTGTVSGSSQVVNILSSLNTYTSSNDTLNTTQNSRLSSLETVTGSLATTYEQKASGTHTLISGSSQVNADTITNFDSNVLTYINSRAVLSGSGYLKNTTDTLTGDLTVTGIITAQEFHTEFISSSIIYQSGSTKFGDTGDDQHQFTGSVSISGSLSTTSNTLVTNLNSDLLDSQQGSYYLSYPNFTNLPTLVSGSSQVLDILTSLNTYTGSNDTLNTTQNSRLSSLEITTGSIQTQVNGISSVTSSYVTLTDSQTLSTGTKTFNNGTFLLRNPANTFSYTLAHGAITAARILNVPVITGTDTLAVLGLAQTFTSKTLTSPVINTQISGTVTSGGNITATNYLIGATGSATLTNKTIALGSNTVSGTKAEFDAACTDGDFLYNGTGVVSGSSQVNADTITNFDPNVLAYINSISVVSGSVVSSYTDLTNIPSGIISSSAQVNADTITNFDANVLTYINSQAVLSGSLNGRTISNLVLTNVTASGSFSGSYQGDGSNLTGITSTGGITWSVITASQNASGSNGYITNSGTLVTLTLPNTNVIESIKVTGKGTGGWQVNLPATWTLNFLDAVATSSIASTTKGDSVELLCIGDNTWQVISSMGNISVN